MDSTHRNRLLVSFYSFSQSNTAKNLLFFSLACRSVSWATKSSTTPDWLQYTGQSCAEIMPFLYSPFVCVFYLLQIRTHVHLKKSYPDRLRPGEFFFDWESHWEIIIELQFTKTTSQKARPQVNHFRLHCTFWWTRWWTRREYRLIYGWIGDDHPFLISPFLPLKSLCIDGFPAFTNPPSKSFR